IYGVQYHPESILSEYGHAQIRLFLQQAGENIARAL
ncbi:MAG: glutamine amidotransferase-related protein, partial [Staphylococcus simulans]